MGKNMIFFYHEAKHFFEIIIDSHTVIRNNTESYHVPFTQFPQMVASFKTPAQYHKENVDIDTVKVHISITTRISLTTPTSPH